MPAIVIDLKDFGVREPDQIVRVFYTLYRPESVKLLLWQVFSKYATNDEKGIAALDKEEALVAVLFDHLIDLVEAIEKLRNEPGSGPCPVCGRSKESGEHPAG
jgi:hypothetical protein